MDADLLDLQCQWRMDSAYGAEAVMDDCEVTQPTALLLEPDNIMPVDDVLAEEDAKGVYVEDALLDDGLLMDDLNLAELCRGTSLDLTMLDACAPSTSGGPACPFVKDPDCTQSSTVGAFNNEWEGTWVPTTSGHGGEDIASGDETPGSCTANNLHHREDLTDMHAAPTSMESEQQQQAAAGTSGRELESLLAIPELGQLPPECLELLMEHPWMLQRVVALLIGCERLRELGVQVLDVLGAYSYPRLQGRDMEAMAEPVAAYISVWCLVEGCVAAYSQVFSIASICFALVKDNCWNKWVEGGGNRARVNANKVKAARRTAALEGLKGAVLVMQQVSVEMKKGADMDKAVQMVAVQLQVVADYMWDPTITSQCVQGALEQLQLQVRGMSAGGCL